MICKRSHQREMLGRFDPRVVLNPHIKKVLRGGEPFWPYSVDPFTRITERFPTPPSKENGCLTIFRVEIWRDWPTVARDQARSTHVAECMFCGNVPIV